MRSHRPNCFSSLHIHFLALLGVLYLYPNLALAQACSPPNCWIGSFYEYDIVAQSTQPVDVGILTGFGNSPSIAETGTVAFVGQVSDSSGNPLGDTLFYGDSGSSNLITVAPSYLNPARTFGSAVQINVNKQIVSQDRFAGSPPKYYVRVWDGNTPDLFTLVAQSGSPLPALLGNPAINFSKDVAFSALDQNFNGLLVQSNPPYSQLDDVTLTTPLRPLIADDGSTIVRAGNTDTSSIVLYQSGLTNALPIATSSEFSALGQSPGISRDGAVVVFAGNLISPGEWDAFAGPGIFAAVIQGGAIKYRMRVAGFHQGQQDGMKNVQIDASTGARSEGVPWCDAGATCVPAGELEDLPPAGNPVPAFFTTFTDTGFQGSTEWENRIAVSHLSLDADGGESIVVSFIATPNIDDSNGLALFSGKQGIWTVRADLFVLDSGSFSHVYRPIPVIQLGDSLGVTGLTVSGLAVYDQLANLFTGGANGDHQVTFWASTTNDRQVIVRSSYIQQFGISGGPDSSSCCFAGTLGALVKVAGTKYILSNDHIFGDPSSATMNNAQVGSSIVEPGLGDHNCSDSHEVSKFYAAPTLNKNVDAALATLTQSEINTTGRIYNIGIPAQGIVTPVVGMHVAKQGRTSGLTCGTIRMTDARLKVTYNTTCHNFKVQFRNQLRIQSNDPGYPFGVGGDSGSLIVDAKTAQPAGLFFASNGGIGYGNSISTVVKQLGNVTGQQVGFVGGPKHVVAGCHFAGSEVLLPRAEQERAKAVKKKYEAALLEDPGVLGVGIGAADDNPVHAVIVIIVERGKKHAPIPGQLEGVRTKTVLEERIVSSASQGCSAIRSADDVFKLDSLY